MAEPADNGGIGTADWYPEGTGNLIARLTFGGDSLTLKEYRTAVFMKKVSTQGTKDLVKYALGPRLVSILARMRRRFLAFVHRRNLIQLATLNGTDKWGSHWYAQHYQTHFGPRRLDNLNLLEIGVGGGDDPYSGGSSLRTWKDYFPNANIYGVDIFDKSALEEERIRIFRGSQEDVDFLTAIAREIGTLDIIVDDGSHVNHHVLTSFRTLFPLLSQGGIYVVEDAQTSYWPEFGGSSEDVNCLSSMLGFFKTLVDALNYEEIIRPGYIPSYLDRNVVAVHFYHNMVFIYKGENKEGSNLLTDNIWPNERLRIQRAPNT